MMKLDGKKIILASASKSRAAMLRNAGLVIETIAADIDEKSVRDAMKDSDSADIAEVLARLKAEAVSKTHAGATVIGADQILSLEKEIFEKPENLDTARETLFKLRGKTHKLISAVAIAKDGETIWTYTDSASLKMRQLSPDFIGRYLGQAGEQVCNSVGAYQLEGLGVQLFEEICGDFFTILGMPLIPLLGALQEQEIISS